MFEVRMTPNNMLPVRLDIRTGKSVLEVTGPDLTAKQVELAKLKRKRIQQARDCAHATMVGKISNYAEYLHKITGHASTRVVRKLYEKGVFGDIRVPKSQWNFICDACVRAKGTQLTFPKKSHREARVPFECAALGFCGKISPPTPEGFEYLLLFVDKYSKMCFPYLCKTRSEFPSKLKDFITMVEASNFRIAHIGSLYSDNALEFFSRDVKDILAEHSIGQSTGTMPYSSVQNPAERYN
jgi:hypothetical protein